MSVVYFTFLSSSSSESFCIFSYFLCSVLHLRKKLTSFSFNQSSFTIASSTKLAGVMQKSESPILFFGFTTYWTTSLSVTDIDDGKCDGDKFEILVTYIEKVTKSMILSPTPETVAIIKSQHDVVTNITAGCSRLFN